MYSRCVAHYVDVVAAFYGVFKVGAILRQHSKL